MLALKRTRREQQVKPAGQGNIRQEAILLGMACLAEVLNDPYLRSEGSIDQPPQSECPMQGMKLSRPSMEIATAEAVDHRQDANPQEADSLLALYLDLAQV